MRQYEQQNGANFKIFRDKFGEHYNDSDVNLRQELKVHFFNLESLGRQCAINKGRGNNRILDKIIEFHFDTY